MDADLIERLAREAGMGCAEAMAFDRAAAHPPACLLYEVTPQGLASLVALVAEECAKEVERLCDQVGRHGYSATPEPWQFAAAIRARFKPS